MKTFFAFLLAVVLALESTVALADCTKHTPYARFGEQVQLVRPCETVYHEVTFRNTDSCECPISCFTLSYGPHFPADEFNAIGVEPVRLLRADGTVHPPYVCLAPGQESRAFLQTKVRCLQDSEYGLLYPSVMLLRKNARWVLPGILDDWFDLEGGPMCLGYDYWQCRQFAYEPYLDPR